MEDLLETQRQLSERKQQLASLVNTLKQEREGTEGIVAEMGAKTQQLRLWLDANEAKVDAVAGMGKEIDIAKAIVPVDALNEQVGAVLSAQPVLHEAFSREAVLEAGQMGGLFEAGRAYCAHTHNRN